MSIDPTVLAEARALVEKAGMADFVLTTAAPASTSGQPVEIVLIDPPSRSPGTPNFDKPDLDRPGVVRSTSILNAIREGTPLPPLVLFQHAGDCRYELLDGFHRFYLCSALGYRHMPAVMGWKFEN
ncbi:MAG TPA: hypothetical protein VF445_07825 [Bordetella sp.]|uniref:hypothetical protein n=1 Tax=Bordetella sp. TaxID=28081 RepID=UPI002ED1941A